MASVLSKTVFEARPFQPWGRELLVSKIMREMARFETLFTDYERACEPVCDDVMRCGRCRTRLEKIGALLAHPQARVWEVWKHGEDSEIVGIIYLTDIIPGCDAVAHYVFFDDELRGKVNLLEEFVSWCFSDHADWNALNRLTITVPDYAVALAKHATRKLGFGGPYTYKGLKGWTIPVEGVKQKAIRWRGRDADLLYLGRLNG